MIIGGLIMRKRVLAFIFTMVVLLSVILLPRTAFADDRYYRIIGFDVECIINPDGSADVTERIKYDFVGSFNGVLRDIDYIETDGIDDIQVFVETGKGGLREFTLNSTDLDAGGPSGTYNLEHQDQLAHLKVFEKSSDEIKVFVYKYTLENVVTKYNDIAEFNRKIVDSSWDVTLEDVDVSVRLPEGASIDDIRVFGHGPLTGESRILDEQNVEFEIDSLSPGDYIGARVLFPTTLVPDSTNIKNEDALAKILDEEKTLADEANAERERARRMIESYNRRHKLMRTIGNVIGILMIISWIPIILLLYIKYDKEFKTNFKAKYYRELPGEYTPAEMSVLVTMGLVNTRDITATLMDLVRKGILILKKETYVRDGFFRAKEVDDYSLTLNPDAPNVPLKRHEEFLIRWFIKTIGRGGHVFLDEISDYARTSSGARQFSNDYQRWCSLVKEEADKNKFFDKTSQKGRIAAILIGMLGFFGSGIALLALTQAEIGVVPVILGIIMFIFGLRLNRRSAYGNEQNAMWKAFKNFLKDFSRLDKAEMPSIIIWEHYLVYAISLGVAKEVIRQLPLVFSDADLQDPRLTFMYGYNMHSFNNFANTFDRTISSVDHAINNAVSVANSTNSSSSGGGGGFSGGGGGGGGRGGGGAF
jgi:uncharacterized membrane protein